MNIYEFRTEGEKEWIVANTAIQALHVYEDITDCRAAEMEDEDDIVLLSDQETKSIEISYEDGSKSSLFDIAKLSDKPEYIASTMC